jgi:2,4-dienoyl-CoA reductase-like NADH-dependent reductase (Old Yellow Enzyme family)
VSTLRPPAPGKGRLILDAEVPFAAHIKRHVPDLFVGTVGNLTGAEECNSIIEGDEADVVFLARQALRDIEFPLHAAQDLGVAVAPAVQYAE